MKNIKLISLEIINFKGAKHQIFNELSESVFIHGKNGSGKTTVFDAFCWLMFGKDSQGRTIFDIKPLDKDNNPLSRVDNEIKATLNIDGEIITLSRVQRESWVKKKGNEHEEFKGNVTHYTFNEVPHSQKEFNAKIQEIIDEGIFKLITNPLAFDSLKWEDKRHQLVAIAGELSEEEIFSTNPDLAPLQKELSNKTMVEYEKQMKVSIKKSKDEKADIPARIDEVSKSKPDAKDFELIENEIQTKVALLADIDLKINNKSKAYDDLIEENNKINLQLSTKRNEISSIENDLRQEVKNKCKIDTSGLDSLNQQLSFKNDDLKSANSRVEQISQDITYNENELVNQNAKRTELRHRFSEEAAKVLVFDENNFVCPTCNRLHDNEDVEATKKELEISFNTNKAEVLELLNVEGRALKEGLTRLEKGIEELKDRLLKGNEYVTNLTDEITELNSKIKSEKAKQITPLNEDEEFAAMLSNSASISKIKIEISSLEAGIKTIPEVNTDDLKTQKLELSKEVDALKLELNDKILIDAADKRINELLVQEKELSKTIVKMEKAIFLIERFNKIKSESLENSVNKMFSSVKFKLFEQQTNGGEKPTCVALVNGVPFDGANTAGRINAGIDIINTLCDFYKVTAPIFIDNRESVTDLIKTDSQVINLVVDDNCEKLTLK